MLISVLERKRLDYSHLPGGASQVITLHPGIETCGYSVVHLFVRVHERNMSLGNQSFTFALYYTLPSPDDPREFTDASPIDSLAVTSAAPGSAPGLLEKEITSPGAYLKLVLTAAQSITGAGTLYAELSAALMLRKQR